jgi:hypothetical protein
MCRDCRFFPSLFNGYAQEWGARPRRVLRSLASLTPCGRAKKGAIGTGEPVAIKNPNTTPNTYYLSLLPLFLYFK